MWESSISWWNPFGNSIKMSIHTRNLVGMHNAEALCSNIRVFSGSLWGCSLLLLTSGSRRSPTRSQKRSLIHQWKLRPRSFDITTVQERKNKLNVRFSSGTSDLHTLSGLFHPLFPSGRDALLCTEACSTKPHRLIWHLPTPVAVHSGHSWWH